MFLETYHRAAYHSNSSPPARDYIQKRMQLTVLSPPKLFCLSPTVIAIAITTAQMAMI